MKYNELQVVGTKARRRVGRGIAAGQGKTAGRGTKGQKSRTGSSKKPGFEGGQNPLLQRLPKLRGFKSHRPTVETVYTGQLQSLGTDITNKVLAAAGLVSNPNTKVKLLAKGDLTKKHNVKLQSASTGAIKLIESTGGSFTQTPQVGREKKAKSDKLATAKA